MHHGTHLSSLFHVGGDHSLVNIIERVLDSFIFCVLLVLFYHTRRRFLKLFDHVLSSVLVSQLWVVYI